MAASNAGTNHPPPEKQQQIHNNEQFLKPILCLEAADFRRRRAVFVPSLC